MVSVLVSPLFPGNFLKSASTIAGITRYSWEDDPELFTLPSYRIFRFLVPTLLASTIYSHSPRLNSVIDTVDEPTIP